MKTITTYTLAVLLLLSPAAGLVMVLAGIWTTDHRWTATGAVLLVCGTLLIRAVNRAVRRKREAANKIAGWTFGGSDE